MKAESFRDKIIRTIEKCEYPVYVIQQDFERKCSCFDIATNEPSVECKKCLGTGHKITIRKIKLASNSELKGDSSLGARASQVIKKYFTTKKYFLEEDNLIIDNNVVYYVYRIEDMRGLEGLFTHQEITGVKKKVGQSTIIRNFYDILQSYKENKRK